MATLDGCLRLVSSKSDLGNVLQKNGKAAVQSLGNTTGAKWSDNFTAFVVSHFLNKCTRVDVVLDRYLQNSIKGVTRAKRKRGKSKGIRRDVESREPWIGNWDSFIVVEENKASQIAHFLSAEMSQCWGTHPGRELVASGGFREILNMWSSDVSRELLQPASLWISVSNQPWKSSTVHRTSRRKLSTRGKCLGRRWSICLPAVQPWDRRSTYQQRENSSISQGKEPWFPSSSEGCFASL